MDKIKDFIAKTREYLKDVMGELSKVNWPSRTRTAKLTGVVFAMVILVMGFLFLLDLPLGYGLEQLVGR